MDLKPKGVERLYGAYLPAVVAWKKSAPGVDVVLFLDVMAA